MSACAPYVQVHMLKTDVDIKSSVSSTRSFCQRCLLFSRVMLYMHVHGEQNTLPTAIFTINHISKSPRYAAMHTDKGAF